MNHHIQHPVINDRLAKLRQKNCPTSEFRRYVQEIAQLMVPAVTADLETQAIEVTTPLQLTQCEQLARPIILVPILRAGLGMLEGFLKLLPEASVAHIGMARNEETLEPESYYFNAPPNLDEADVIVLDPMLATGGSAIAALKELQNATETLAEVLGTGHQFAVLHLPPLSPTPWAGFVLLRVWCPDSRRFEQIPNLSEVRHHMLLICAWL